MSEYAIVGGTFDEKGGKPSRVIEMLMAHMGAHGLNGGTLEELRSFDFMEPKVLVWMPNVSNDEEKILPTIKEQNPKLLLVSSKVITGRDFTAGDMVGRLLKSKSNLGIMIDKADDIFEFTVLDPLGNLWCKTTSVPALAYALQRRIGFLLNKVRRAISTSIGEERSFVIDPHFIEIVRDMGNQFSKFVNAVNPNRLLGNAATRCTSGFPALRSGGRLFVTKRNVEKTTLSASDFVEVQGRYGDTKVTYYGDAKPSVDTPMQVALFHLYPEINYMLHGHVYVKDAPMTELKLPCGAVEEADEIHRAWRIKATLAQDVAVNLKGHGFIILARNLDFFDKVTLIGRPFPEE